MTKKDWVFLCVVIVFLFSTCSTAPTDNIVVDMDIAMDMDLNTYPGTVYYVSVNGNDSNPGSAEQPFRTINKAAETVKPGDTVIVKEGTYREIVKAHTSGEANAWIKFMANPADKVLVEAPVGEYGGYGRGFEVRASYIHIEGFEITSGDEFGAGISISGTDEKPVHHFRVFNNTVRDCGGSGIGAGYADYLHIRGNIVYRNAFTSSWQESGINNWEGRAFDRKKGYHNVIENNICFDNQNVALPNENVGGGDKTTDGNGIIIDWCYDKNSSTLIRNNICFNNGGRGIQLTASVNVTVINNTMYMNSKDRFSNGELGNHSVLDSSRKDIGAENIYVQNNIMYARPNQPCLTIWDKPGCVYDYNLYYNETGIMSNGETTNSDRKDRQPGNHKQNNILNKDPEFVKTVFVNGRTANPSLSVLENYDFSLRSTSPFFNTDLGAIAF